MHSTTIVIRYTVVFSLCIMDGRDKRLNVYCINRYFGATVSVIGKLSLSLSSTPRVRLSFIVVVPVKILS